MLVVLTATLTVFDEKTENSISSKTSSIQASKCTHILMKEKKSAIFIHSREGTHNKRSSTYHLHKKDYQRCSNSLQTQICRNQVNGICKKQMANNNDKTLGSWLFGQKMHCKGLWSVNGVTFLPNGSCLIGSPQRQAPNVRAQCSYTSV